MTAVEWLVHQICGKHTEAWHEEIQQAQEMEKQQIIDANIAGLIYPYVPGKPFGLEIAERSKAEQYYNKTYNK